MNLEEPKFGSLVELLRLRAADQPDRRVKTFLNGEGAALAHLTYAELDLKARAIAARLQQSLRPGARALLLYPPGLEFTEAFFGCLYAGVVAVPAPPPDPRRLARTLPRVAAMLEDAAPAVVLTVQSLVPDLEAIVEAEPRLGTTPWLATDGIESSISEDWEEPRLGRNTLAYLQYTSGSTAAPKGVMSTHGHVLDNAEYLRQGFDYDEQSIALIWVPNYHDDGLIHGVVQSLYTGCLSLRMSPMDVVRRPLAWLRAISHHRVTHTGGPNFIYELTKSRVREQDREGLDLSSWRVAYNAAEPIRPSTLRGFYEAFAPHGFRWTSACPAFGMAETTLLVAAKAKDQEPVILRLDGDALERHHRVEEPKVGSSSRELVGCGRAVGKARFVIVDPETQQELPEGSVGELWIQDRCVAEGYWQRLDATCETFEARLATTGEGPFLRTGDLAFLRDDELFIAGRLKDLIILRGRNLYPQDLELSAEVAHPQFRRGCTAAFSVPFALNRTGDERLVIVQEVQAACSAEEAEDAVGGLRQAVAQEHDVEVWAVVLITAGSLPKTSSGKIQRAACRAAFLGDDLSVVLDSRQGYVASSPLVASDALRVPVSQEAPQEPIGNRRKETEPHNLDAAGPAVAGPAVAGPVADSPVPTVPNTPAPNTPALNAPEAASQGPSLRDLLAQNGGPQSHDLPASSRQPAALEPTKLKPEVGVQDQEHQAAAGPKPSELGPAAPALGEVEVAEWMTQRLAGLLGMDPQHVDPRQPFARYGLGSAAMVGLAAELEDWLGRTLPQTVLYEHASIDAVSRFLLSEGEEARTQDGVQPAQEPIAIIGLGCRFPGASGPRELWTLLQQAVDAVTEVPADRWNADEVYQEGEAQVGKTNSRWGGFLEDVDRFDPYFFGISPREAERMDPQQRLLLEVAWETLEDGGVVPSSLAGSDTGVFVGIGMSDYGRWLFEDRETSDAYSGTGGALSIAANRISYCLDLRGPSLAVDTACSSSLVAILEACQGLWRGDCSLALAGGANVLLSPEVTVNFSQGGFLASDGRCKTFDSRADGYVRSEGAGLVLLKPLRQAQADGDRVYAVVRGGAVNQDGRSNGLTAPNPEAQRQMLSLAYDRAGVDPAAVQYVEAHGTGTPLGDPIEAQALGEVLGAGRGPEEACALGSIKTNLGHLETAAGVAGLMKVALSLRHQERAPNLHYEQANPRIRFAELGLRVQDQSEAWPATGPQRVAGVSSFGFGGTNAHVVLEEAPRDEKLSAQGSIAMNLAASDAAASDSLSMQGRVEHLVPLSAHSVPALRQRAADLAEWLRHEQPSLDQLVDTASRRRGHLDHRWAMAAGNLDDLRSGLAAFGRDEPAPAMAVGLRPPAGPAPLAFVFSGQGSQWPGMGCQLMRDEPVFRQRLEEAAKAIALQVEWSPLEELAKAAESSRLTEIDIIQPLIFAVQVSLAALWQSWGVRPDWVVGHSLGEVAAACVAGALSLDDGARVICHRSRLMRRASGKGTMLAAEVGGEAAQQLLEEVLREVPGQASIAVHSSPSAVAFSGEAAPLAEIQRRLEAQEIFCRKVKVDVAAHSPHMDPLLDELGAAIQDLKPAALSFPMISTVTSQEVKGEELDARYWKLNLRQPVRFATAIKALLEQGVETFLEMSAHPLVTGAISQIALQSAPSPKAPSSKASMSKASEAAGGQKIRAFPSLRRDESERGSLMASLGEVYCLGHELQWERLAADVSSPVEESSGLPKQGRELVDLPLYPWQRERFWFERRPRASSESGQTDQAISGSRISDRTVSDSTVSEEGASVHPLLGQRIEIAGRRESLWQGAVTPAARGLLEDHRVRGMAVFPGAAWFEMALTAAGLSLGKPAPDHAGQRSTGGIELRQVQLHEALVVPPSQVEDGCPGLELQTRCWTADEEAAGDAPSSSVEIYSRLYGGLWRLHLSALAFESSSDRGLEAPSLVELKRRCSQAMNVTEHRDRLLALGYQYGARFQGLTALRQAPSSGDAGSGEAPGSKEARGAKDTPPLEVLGRIDVPPELAAEEGLFSCHPALLDVGWQVAAALLPRDGGSPESQPWIPVGSDGFSLGAVLGTEEGISSSDSDSLDSGLPNSMWVHVSGAFEREAFSSRASCSLSSPDSSLAVAMNLRVHVTLLQENGEVVAQTRGLEVRRLQGESRDGLGVAIANLKEADSAATGLDTGTSGEIGPQQPEDWLYEPHWRLLPSVTPLSKESISGDSGDPSCWVVFADSEGVGGSLAERLRKRGDQVILAWADSAGSGLGSSGEGASGQGTSGGGAPSGGAGASEDFFVDATDPSAVRDVLHRAVRSATSSIRGIVYLWALDAPRLHPLEPEGVEDLLWQSRALTSQVPLQLLQELALGGGETPPRLWMATRGAVQVDDADGPVALSQAPIWGLGRVVAHEQPELLGAVVDLDAGALPEDSSASLVAALTREDRDSPLSPTESQMAWRWGSLYVPRLVRSVPPGKNDSMTVRQDGTYWITGGTSGLGFEVARRLVEKGARHLVLLSRRGLVEAASLEAVAAWTAAGVRVRGVSADVADKPALETLMEDLRRQGWPEVVGVVHAAGVVQDSALAETTAESLDAVLRPKVLGGWALHHLFQRHHLDFFVLFSSAASILGNPGQANYSAANAFLDALATHRRALGLTATAINWGLWSQVGFASRRADAAEHLADLGFGTLEPSAALDLMESLSATELPQVLVLPALWARLERSGTALGRSPLLTEMFAEAKQQEMDRKQASRGIAIEGAREGGEGTVSQGTVSESTVSESTVLEDTALEGTGSEGTGSEAMDFASSGERHRWLLNYLRQGLGDVLRMPPSRLSEDIALTGLGLDSLVAVEWRNRMQTDLKREVPLARLLGGATLSQVAQQLSQEMASESMESAAGPGTSQPQATSSAGASQEESATLPKGATPEPPVPPSPAESPPPVPVSPEEAVHLLDRVDVLSIAEAEGLLQRLEGVVAS